MAAGGICKSINNGSMHRGRGKPTRLGGKTKPARRAAKQHLAACEKKYLSAAGARRRKPENALGKSIALALLAARLAQRQAAPAAAWRRAALARRRIVFPLGGIARRRRSAAAAARGSGAKKAAEYPSRAYQQMTKKKMALMAAAISRFAKKCHIHAGGASRRRYPSYVCALFARSSADSRAKRHHQNISIAARALCAPRARAAPYLLLFSSLYGAAGNGETIWRSRSAVSMRAALSRHRTSMSRRRTT